MIERFSVVVFSSIGDGLVRLHASEAATKAVQLLERHAIPLVFCSSQTRAELELIQGEFGISHPFIAESGGAVFVPKDYFDFEVGDGRDVAGYRAVEFGRPHADIVETLHRVAGRLQIDIVGFNEMSVEEVAIDRGLPLLQALRAKVREYDEPFRIIQSDAKTRRRLAAALEAANVACTNHGRYEHAGSPVDARSGMEWLCAMYRTQGQSVFTVGLGETPNDAAMLRHVDLPLVVDNDPGDLAGSLLRMVPGARLTDACGAAGWADAIVTLVDAVLRCGLCERSSWPVDAFPQQGHRE